MESEKGCMREKAGMRKEEVGGAGEVEEQEEEQFNYMQARDLGRGDWRKKLIFTFERGGWGGWGGEGRGEKMIWVWKGEEGGDILKPCNVIREPRCISWTS